MAGGKVTYAAAMIKAGNYGAATAVLEQHLKGNGADPDALYLYGTALYRANRNAEAENAFRRLTAARPADARAHYSLGITLARLGRADEARSSFEAALAADPSFVQARQRLAAMSPAQPAPSDQPAPADDDKHLTAGNLVGSGHRRLSSYAGRFALAALLAALGLVLIGTHEPGRLRWFAEHPPFQIPSVPFLRDRYEATGQEVHRRELQQAVASARSRSGLFDDGLLVTYVALFVVGIGVAGHALIAAPLTRYEVYERRIDATTGVLYRRRLSAWLYEIIDVEMRQTPALTLTRNAEVRIYLPQTAGSRPSRRNDRSQLRIIGFGSLRDQERLWHEIRDAALKERRVMRRWYL